MKKTSMQALVAFHAPSSAHRVPGDAAVRGTRVFAVLPLVGLLRRTRIAPRASVMDLSRAQPG